MGNVNMEASQIHYRGGNRPMSVEEALKEGGGGSLNLEVIAPTFSETAQYLEGDLVFYDDKLYRFDADHDPGAWDSTEVMETNIAENLVMFPGDGLRRTIHTYDVKLQSGGGLSFDANGALYTNIVRNYNTNEQPTGQKWIDGKDIYFKTYSNIQLTNNTPVVVDSDFGGANNIIDMRVILDGISSNTRKQYISNSYNEGGSYSVFPEVNGDSLQIVVRGDWSNYTAAVVVYYTKTV